MTLIIAGPLTMMDLVLSCGPLRGRGQRSSLPGLQQLRVWAALSQLVGRLGLPSINIFQSFAVYSNLSLSFRSRQWSLAYFWDRITFFIHREVRFRYRRSIVASIMLTLLIRKMLYEDRLVYWICLQLGSIQTGEALCLHFIPSLVCSSPCVLFTPLGLRSLPLAYHVTPWFGPARLQREERCLIIGRRLGKQSNPGCLWCPGFLLRSGLSRLRWHERHQQEQ